MKGSPGYEALERTLRRALQARADQVQPSADALARIRRRIRVGKAKPVRRIGLAAAVAAAVAVVVVLPTALRDSPQHNVADRGVTQLTPGGSGLNAAGSSPGRPPTLTAATSPAAAPPTATNGAPGVVVPSPSPVPDTAPEAASASTYPTGVPATDTAVSFAVHSVTNVSTAVGYALANSTGCASCAVIYKTSDSGATWAPLAPAPAPLADSSDPSSAGVWGLRFADQDNGWLYGSALYATHDGGRTWSPVPLDGRRVRALEVHQGAAYAVVATCDAKVCKSAELLATAVDANAFIPALTLPSTARDDPPSLSFGAGGGGILRVGEKTWVDDGPGWNEVSSPQCPGGESAAASAVSGHAVFVFCLTSDHDVTAISVWRSQDAGRSWAQIGAGTTLSAGAVTVTAASATTLGIATDTSSLKISFDGGKSWTVPATAAPIAGWRYLGARGADLITAVAAHTRPGLWSSADSGHTWSAVPIQ